jgi:hypothetical protein
MKLIASILITAIATKVAAHQPKIGIDLENKFKNHNITNPTICRFIREK